MAKPEEKSGGGIRTDETWKYCCDSLIRAGQVQSSAYRTDRAGQDIIKQQGRHRKFRGGATHRLAHDSVHTAAHEHAATLYVNRAHGIGKKHYRKDEQG